MSNNLLHTAGEALYGPRWQSDLARALDVSDRTVRRWVAGGDMPNGVYVDILRLVVERQAELDDLAEALKRAGAP